MSEEEARVLCWLKSPSPHDPDWCIDIGCPHGKLHNRNPECGEFKKAEDGMLYIHRNGRCPKNIKSSKIFGCVPIKERKNNV